MSHNIKYFLPIATLLLLPTSLVETTAANAPPKIILIHSFDQTAQGEKEWKALENASKKCISYQAISPKTPPDFTYKFILYITEAEFNATKGRFGLSNTNNNTLPAKQVERIINFFLQEKGFDYTIEINDQLVKGPDDTVFGGQGKASFSPNGSFVFVNFKQKRNLQSTLATPLLLTFILLQLYLSKEEGNKTPKKKNKPRRELLAYPKSKQ